MEKLIIKYLTGETTVEEAKMVREWALESEENMEIFVKEKNLRVATMMPDVEASDSEADAFVDLLREHDRKKPANNSNPNKIRIWVTAAASVAAVALIVLSVSLSVFSAKNRDLKEELAFITTQQLSYHQNSTPYGVKGKVVLPDSSVVYLNSGSSIYYPSKFHGENREVDFTGEGYFEVRENSAFPMKISLSNGMSVYVKGTTFNLSSYENDRSLSLLLLSGKVSLLDNNSNEIVKLLPKEKLLLDKTTSKISVIRPQDIVPTVGWKKGWLVFDETTMPEILKKLERWYGVNVVVNDSTIMTKTLTAKFREESLSQVLELMHRISLIDYTLKDSTAFLKSYSKR
ncbi:MAG: FecR family protein [Bacteroidales bacterium]|nr:FecR family protein [Bacteroidales bacterium]